ncbi:MAG: hypothetical protein KGL35_33010 [Bradyrhizobium sp.]|nr:hypothetical protein [Pseudomonadota bacterium]MDE2473403.1 hypothetical protein [Bradyrhizobium sp.]
MALHRDIFWVGKQWAVTGYGMQAVDQKQKSRFDIEASRLWEDDLLESLSEQRWFNPDDFNAGLSIARARYPQPGSAASRKMVVAKESTPVAPPKSAPPAESGAEPKAELSKTDISPSAAKSQPAIEPVGSAPGGGAKSKPAPPLQQHSTAQFNMRIERWPARFTLMWRVRIRL